MTELRNTGGGRTAPQERPIPRIDVSRDAIGAFCRRWRVTELAVLGSVLRDDFGPDSDVDVLVRFEPDARPSLFDIVQMQEELGETFGREVDLGEFGGVENSRNYIRRKAILESARVVYPTAEKPSSSPRGRSTQRDDQSFLLDMLLAARDAADFVSGRTYAEFMNDREAQLATCWTMEVVGRAASHVSPDFRKAHPEIAWGEIMGLRNCFIPDSCDIDVPRVWNAANSHPPKLIAQLEPLIPPETGPRPNMPSL